MGQKWLQSDGTIDIILGRACSAIFNNSECLDVPLAHNPLLASLTVLFKEAISFGQYPEVP